MRFVKSPKQKSQKRKTHLSICASSMISQGKHSHVTLNTIFSINYSLDEVCEPSLLRATFPCYALLPVLCSDRHDSQPLSWHQ